MESLPRRLASLSTVVFVLGAARLAAAAPTEVDETPPSAATPEPLGAKDAAPLGAFAYDAKGMGQKGLGVATYGLGTKGGPLGGGATVFGAPTDSVTIVADARRDLVGRFTPSAAVVVRLLGANTGWSLGVLGKFKIDGFARGPNDELESELESGVLVSFHGRGLHVDLNAIAGAGLGDEGEVDGEGRARLGLDVAPFLRVGLDGQLRARLRGTERLPGGRTWDFAAGPQVLVGNQSFFAGVTAGPSTTGVASGVGFMGQVTVGGLAF